MIFVRLFALAIGMSALGVLFVGLVSMVMPYLPGFEEEFIRVSGVPMERFGHAPSTYSLFSLAVGVLPWLAISLAAAWTWKTVGRKECDRRDGHLRKIRKSAGSARAWLTGLASEPVGEAGAAVCRPPKGLLSFHYRFLVAAVRGESTSHSKKTNSERDPATLENIASWAIILLLVAMSFGILLLALWATLSNLVYRANSIPFDLRLARALVGGFGFGWVALLLLAGAAGVLHLHRDRRGWKKALDSAENESKIGFCLLAKEALQEADASEEPRPPQVDQLFRRLASRVSARDQ